MAKSELEGGGFWDRRHKVQEGEKRKICSVRPGSNEELEKWQAIAKAQKVSLHSLLLYLIRKGMKEIETGDLVIEKEPVTTERIKMP
ncbi:MAG: hypothetical protein ACYCZF_09515 [Anaerolineae bacterium]